MTLKVLPESDDPVAVKFRATFEKQFPDLARQGRPDLGDVLSYGGAQVFVEALKRAGAQLTQAGFIKALESLKNYERALTLPTTFGPNLREGSANCFSA